MPNKKKKISIIAPMYNEAESLCTFYERITNLVKTIQHLDFEFIFIDDGSKDNSLNISLELLANDERIKIIELSKNFGKEAALTAGLDLTSGDAVIPIDVDMQNPIELIPRLIQEWENGYDVVLPKRINREIEPMAKKIFANLFYKIQKFLTNDTIPENAGDFRLIDKKVVEALKNMSERQRFMKGIFSWVGFKTISIPFSMNKRLLGESKFSFFKLWNFAIEGITSFSTIPLRIWSYIGFIGTVFSMLYLFWILIKTSIYGVDVPGYASLLVTILFFGSVQLIGIGILGEYIGRIYMETKRRPIYIINKIHEKK